VNLIIPSNKAPHLFPSLGLRTPDIEAPDVVLLHGRDARGLIVKPSIVAEHDPTLSANDIEPLIVLRVMFKAVVLIMMIFNRKWRLGFPEGFWKAFAEATVKIEC
jgi:hypothetical protein